MRWQWLKWFILFGGWLCLSCGLATSQPQQLHHINDRIGRLQSTLLHDKVKQGHWQQQLANIETHAGQAHVALKQLAHQLAEQREQLRHLKHQQQLWQMRYHEQQVTVAAQLRIAYLLGQQPYLKLLLSQAHVNNLARLLTYYQYLSAAHVKAIQRLASTLVRIKRNQHLTQKQTHQLTGLRKKQRQASRQLHVLASKRQRLLAHIKRRIAGKEQRLLQLKRNKKRLQTVLYQLAREKTHHHFADFAHLRRKLKWPVTGHLARLFGQPINHSQLKWQGVLLYAPKGHAVHAIASGQVIFAKWLPGYGLLMIVNHGHGYLTLYGRNQVLLKSVGSWVRSGDAISKVGTSGGYKKSALYFAIRHGAKALDPVRWCRRF